MFNKLRKTIARKFLRIPVINRRVQDIRSERHHLRWELIMSGKTMRDTNTDKPCREVRVDYMCQPASQGGVVPVYIDSVNWGGM